LTNLYVNFVPNYIRVELIKLIVAVFLFLVAIYDHPRTLKECSIYLWMPNNTVNHSRTQIKRYLFPLYALSAPYDRIIL
jgi:hypothetical protein